MLRALVATGLVVVLLMTLLWALQRHLVYVPGTDPVGPAGDVLPGARDVELRTADGLRLGAWFVPARGGDRGLTVLVAPGNAGDRSLRAPLARALSREGLSVLLLDYRGYAGNPGSPSEEGLALDVRAARSFLVDDEGIPAERLLYLGESLGAAVATELATEHPPAGLILRSPFVDLASVGSHHYPFLPVRTLLRDRYPLAASLAEVDAPVSVVLGTGDAVVPAEQSRRVAEAAPRLRQLVEIPGADHNDPALVSGRPLVTVVTDLADLVAPDGRDGG
jgi:pimeloyl-ACP methyl ester carboxylesterase